MIKQFKFVFQSKGIIIIFAFIYLNCSMNIGFLAVRFKYKIVLFKITI